MSRWPTILCSVLVALSAAAEAVAAATSWDLAPYQVELAMAFAGPELESPRFQEMLSRQVVARLHTGIGHLWKPTVNITTGAERAHLLRAGASPPALSAAQKEFDKIFFLRLTQIAGGLRLEGLEYDGYLQLSGEVQAVELADLQAASEAIFQLVVKLFAPLAKFRVTGEGTTVALEFKGEDLLRRYRPERMVAPGDVLTPYFRRTDYTGALAANGLLPAAWTVLQVDASADPQAPTGATVLPQELTAAIVSHTPRPFGLRRLGRVEQLALFHTALRAPVTLRLHVEGLPEEPLAGYEVFRQTLADKSLVSLGRTDRLGEMRIAPAEAAIDMLYVRLGSQLVARAPIAFTGERVLTIPLPDERPRLAADATLAALREELVDLVARRNILASRVDKYLDAEEPETARKLLSELDLLPGRALFERELYTASQQHRSPDPRVQRRIDSAFAAMRKLLGEFLDSTRATELNARLASMKSE